MAQFTDIVYIPREEEYIDKEYVITHDYLIFTRGYYKEVKKTRTVYDKYKKIPKLDSFGYDLILTK